AWRVSTIRSDTVNDTDSACRTAQAVVIDRLGDAELTPLKVRGASSLCRAEVHTFGRCFGSADDASSISNSRLREVIMTSTAVRSDSSNQGMSVTVDVKLEVPI